MHSINKELISTVVPDSQEHWLQMRAKDITSTEVSALFGLNPYLTAFELWHRKKENVVADFQANERTLWGNRLEAAIAEASAQEKGWKIRKAPEYVSVPQLRIGSSFDYMIQSNIFVDEEILEIKNVDSLVFKDGWLTDDDGEIEAPPHIEIQIQQQMLLKPHIKRTRIRALVGGNRMVEIVREPDINIQGLILKKTKEFWDSIDNNIEPEPNFSLDDETLAKLYGYAEPGKLIDVSGDERVADLVSEYNSAQAAYKLADERKKAAKNEILTIIGDAEKAVGAGFSISAGVVGEAFVPAYNRASYRSMRIYSKKVKS